MRIHIQILQEPTCTRICMIEYEYTFYILVGAPIPVGSYCIHIRSDFPANETASAGANVRNDGQFAKHNVKRGGHINFVTHIETYGFRSFSRDECFKNRGTVLVGRTLVP